MDNGRTGFTKPGLEATKSPSIKDIYWIAGFLEGEGSFYCNKQIAVSAYQKDAECLNRLKEFLGGTISKHIRNKEHGEIYYQWRTSGARARGIALTVFSLMSERRKKQIKDAFLKQNVLR